MQRIGRYEVISELGRGAMGVVYRARDTEIGRIVALKVVLTAHASAQDIEKYKQRFHREAQAAGRLSHPGIVTIHDIAEDEAGQPYIVMEFVEGRPLNLLLGPTAHLPLDQLLDIGIQVAQALDYAHRNGVIHRDIKPPNILVTPDGRAKLADFGVARLEGTELTQEGTSLGTPSYMSPEQFRGGVIDGRSDIFSLGSVLYWMCTGKKPFPGDTITLTSFQVAYENPVPPTEAKTDLPKELDEILSRCLAKNPANRYATCGDLAADLEALKAGRPLGARLDSDPDRTAPFALPPRKSEAPRKDAPAQMSPDDSDAETRVAVHATDSAVPRLLSVPKGKGTAWIAVSFVALLLAMVLASKWLAQRGPAGQPAAPADTAAIPAQPSAAGKSSGVAPVESAPPASAKPSSPAPSGKVAEALPVQSSLLVSNLQIFCKFPFKKGTLDITMDGKTFLHTLLEEKKKGGIFSNREFEQKDNPIAVGQHRFRVRVASNDGDLVWEDTIPGTIAKEAAGKLKIDFKDGSENDPGKRKLVLTLEVVK